MVRVASAALRASGDVGWRYFSAGISRPLLPPAKAFLETWRTWNAAKEGLAAAGAALGRRTAKRVNIMAWVDRLVRWDTKGGAGYMRGTVQAARARHRWSAGMLAGCQWAAGAWAHGGERRRGRGHEGVGDEPER